MQRTTIPAEHDRAYRKAPDCTVTASTQILVPDPANPLTSLLANALDSDYSHVPLRRCLQGVDARLAGQVPDGVPHSIFQIVRHLAFWQDFFLQRLDGVAVPEPAEDYWPANPAPTDDEDWREAQAQLFRGLEEAHRQARGDRLEEPLPLWPGKPRMEAVRIMASHNSYHAGQIVLLRQLLGAWPPGASA